MRLLLVVLLALWSREATAGDEVVTIPSLRPGVTQRVLLSHPASPPAASLMMFLGGGGATIPEKPSGNRGGNFLARTTDLWVAAGFLVAIVGNPSDRSAAIWNFRTEEKHARDVAAVVAYLRRSSPAPVWAVGTSMGTLSAANAAARLGPDGPDGVVLTSSVVISSQLSRETVMTVDLDQIRVPLLAVAHAGDVCRASPPEYAARIVRAASNSPKRQVLSFSGGKPMESDACEPFAPHGFYGVEAEAVAAIGDWIKAAK